MSFSITRQIGFDYGHRVHTHGSKCRNIHGHRGKVEVTCTADSLHANGEQKDMVLDFGFLKEVMMEVVDKSIDHGFIACIDDIEVMEMLCSKTIHEESWIQDIYNIIKDDGYYLSSGFDNRIKTKLYVVPFIPTSERLAEHFFKRLIKPIEKRSKGLAKIVNLRFWETPNCYSDYPGFSV